MIPAELISILRDAPALHHLGEGVDEPQWGRSAGFPVVLVNVNDIDEEAFMELADEFADAFDEMGIALFNEEGWVDERYVLIGVTGVFDDPDAESLDEAFPHVAQLDGLLLWDTEESAVFMMETELDTSRSLEENLARVADDVPSLMEALS